MNLAMHGHQHGRIGYEARFQGALNLRTVGFSAAHPMFQFFMGRNPDLTTIKDKERLNNIEGGIRRGGTGHHPHGCYTIMRNHTGAQTGETLVCPFVTPPPKDDEDGEGAARWMGEAKGTCAQMGGISRMEFSSPAEWMVAVHEKRMKK
jgi:hypothetical protein